MSNKAELIAAQLAAAALVKSIWGDIVYNAKTYGAAKSKSTTQNKAAVQAAISAADDAGGGIVLIPPLINYGYNRNDVTTHPDLSGSTNNLLVIDYSVGNTYSSPGRDGMQVRYFMHTEGDQSDGQHDGNTFWIRGPWAPALMMMNDGVSTNNRRVTLFFGNRGVVNWGVGQGTKTIEGGTDDDLSDFAIVANNFAGGTGLTNVFGIDKSTGEFGIGGQPISGVAYTFLARYAGNFILRYMTQGPNQSIDQQFYVNGALKRRIQVDKDGVINYISSSGSNVASIDTDGTMWGFRNKVTVKTGSYTATVLDCKTTFTNTGATAGYTITLPAATPGLEYSFFVDAAFNVAAKPASGENFRGVAVNTDKRSSTQGSFLNVRCFVAGVWEVITQTGTWT